MMMTKTDYTIKDLKVYKSGKLEAHGFGDIESALHSIWVMEGKRERTFFVESEGIVYLKEELKED